MNEIRNFILASVGTFGLIEASNPEQWIPETTEPQSMFLKTILTLLAGLITSLITHRVRRDRNKNKPQNEKIESSDTHETKKE